MVLCALVAKIRLGKRRIVLSLNQNWTFFLFQSSRRSSLYSWIGWRGKFERTFLIIMHVLQSRSSTFYKAVMNSLHAALRLAIPHSKVLNQITTSRPSSIPLPFPSKPWSKNFLTKQEVKFTTIYPDFDEKASNSISECSDRLQQRPLAVHLAVRDRYFDPRGERPLSGRSFGPAPFNVFSWLARCQRDNPNIVKLPV